MTKAEQLRRWDIQAYQDALRPERDQRVEAAVVVTYSLDLPSVAAALLSLARQDNDKGSGNSVPFITAVNQLRGRFRVLVQKGQIHKPRPAPKLSSLLDQFLREVPTQRSRQSWHPKAFLIKLKSTEQTQWRFWMGSKNLTREEAWDLGMLFVSAPLGEGTHIPGLVDAAIRMTRRAGLAAFQSETLRRELDEIKWQIPSGVRVEEILWLDAEKRPYPEIPPKTSKLFVVSPFLDRKTLAYFGGKGQQRLLLSLDYELARIKTETPGALTPFSGGLHAMTKASSEVETVSAESDELTATDSLHAKIFYAEAGKKRVLWVGSANATSRGWNGPNVELVARLELNAEMASALEYFIVSQRILDEREIPLLPEEPDASARRRLDSFRDEFLYKYQFTQHRSQTCLRIIATPAPELPEGFTLRMGTLLGDLVEWPSGTAELLLPPAELHEECELVQVQVEFEGIFLNWLQAAPLTPPPSESRDAAVIRKHLSCREILDFLRMTLGGMPTEKGRSWDDDDGSAVGRSSRASKWSTPLPTLEEVLKSDRARLVVFDRYYRDYLENREVSRSGLNQRELELLTGFESMWNTVRTVLLPGGGR
jgi:hypothetical protein